VLHPAAGRHQYKTENNPARFAKYRQMFNARKVVTATLEARRCHRNTGSLTP